MTDTTQKDTLKPLQGFFFRDFRNSYIPNILDEVYLKKVYQPLLTGKHFKTIVCFGANIGLTAYYFKDYADTVYAVEPSKIHLESLRKMIEFNKIDNVKVCPYAIAEKNGTEKFYHPENITMYSRENVTGVEDFEEVETVTMQEFMKREKIDKIDFAEIDIEGSEAKLFASDSFKNAIPKLDRFVFEYHDWCGVGIGQLINTVRDLGYAIRKMPADAQVFECVKI